MTHGLHKKPAIGPQGCLMKISKALTVVAVVGLCIALFTIFRSEPAWQAFADDKPITPNNSAGIWLDRPDAILRSESLTELPKDLLRVRLLKDVLTEDFLFYYDDDEDWLGLKGAIRRIAYEHDLDLSDKLLSLLLDRPVDAYLWRDGKGALRHYVLTLERNSLVDLATTLAKVALSGDRQLKQHGEFAIGSAKVPVWTLKLSPRRMYVLLLYRDRLALLSSEALAFTSKGQLDTAFIAAATRWLAPDEKDRLALFEGYQLPAQIGGKHSLLLSSRFLSQGYSTFFPELAALRFDYRDNQWSTLGLLNLPAQQPAASFNRTVWQQLPVDPAACALIPANWLAMDRFLPGDKSFNKKAARTVMQQLQPSGAVCWYADARLYEPLFIANFKDQPGANVDKSLAQLFDWTIGTAGKDKVHGGENATALTVRKQKNTVLWSREIPVLDEQQNPTLARTGNALYFSVNADLVAKALSVSDMRYPAVTDTLPANAGTIILHSQTAKLAQLIEQEVRQTVDASEDKAIVENRLQPRLKAMATHGQIDLALPSATLSPGQQWHELQWIEH